MDIFEFSAFVTAFAAAALLIRIIQNIYYAKKRREIEEIYEETVKRLDRMYRKHPLLIHDHVAEWVPPEKCIQHRHPEQEHSVYMSDGKTPWDGHRIITDELPKKQEENPLKKGQQ